MRIACTRVRFEPGVRRGQFTVTAIDGGAFDLVADAIVTSIGQDPDLAALGGAVPADGALVGVDAMPGDPRRRASGPVATSPAWRAS